MKKNPLFYFLPILFLISCIKHEIIPAPSKTVELTSSFKGSIGGTDIKWLQNVDDYNCIPSQIKNLNTIGGGQSSVVFISTISSTSVKGQISVRLGTVNWTQYDTPTNEIFTKFLDGVKSKNPTYSREGKFGFEVKYIDNLGVEWVSDSASAFPQNVTFTNLSYDSEIKNDKTLDYCKFTATFNCHLFYYDKVKQHKDSIEVQNAVFKGWFMRQQLIP
jgi:hypothetical protein